MKIGIVGSGPAGLNALKHSLAEGFEAMCFEQHADIGGEWYTTGAVGKNEYGVEAHSKIYEGLYTNLPKQIMSFDEHPHGENGDNLFVTADTMHKYIKSYADKFDLNLHIKLEHQVIRVRPLNIDNKWEVIVKNLPNNGYETFIFDKIFICTGLYYPWMPNIEGQENFNGQIVHSRDYRNGKMYKNKKVLLIGSGFSALDMVLGIGKEAERLLWTHKIPQTYGKMVNIDLPGSVVETLSVKRITENGVEFVDGVVEEVSIIVYATGHDFVYPFLSVDSGMSVREKCVYPLYKECINIMRPSLAIIGLPFIALAMPMFALQIQFCLQYWSGRKPLPSKAEMLKDTNDDFQLRGVGENMNSHQVHYLGLERHEKYYNDLAQTAGIQPMKPVLIKMFNHNLGHLFENLSTYRCRKYKMLNDFEFECDCGKN